MGNRYTALVRGPSPVFARGCPWVILLWYAVIAGAITFKARLPAWYGPVVLGALLVGALTMIAVLRGMRSNALVVDDSGITLGLRGGSRRRLGRRRGAVKYLPWTHIEQVRIAPRLYGARLEIFPRPSLDWPRPSRLAGIVAVVITLILPVSYLVRRPALLSPRAHPRRYRIPLCDIRPDQVATTMTMLAAPAGVQVAITRRWPLARPGGPPRLAGGPAALPQPDLRAMTGPQART